MGSINATLVAHKVSETIRKNKKVVLGEIIKSVGYSEQTSLSPQRVTNTQSFRTALDLNRQPILEGLQKEINEIKLAMSKKNKNKEEYRTLVATFDLLTKNYQLLSGGATERQVFVLPSEVMNKNNIEITKDSANYSDTDKLEGQVVNQEEK